MAARFLVGIYTAQASTAESLKKTLAHSPFAISWSKTQAEFVQWTISNRHRIDCLVVQRSHKELDPLQELLERDILLPILVISNQNTIDPQPNYHNAVICMTTSEIDRIEGQVHEAINQFLQLPASQNPPIDPENASPDTRDNRTFLLSLQQQRLTEKLQERLGYLGVYYKRNSQNFMRNMTLEERHEFLDQLRQDYRQIILSYFSSDDKTLNQRIDDYVNLAFFADVSISKVVEIHMELMDHFSKQLNMEGRSEEILLDYRLTLIDVLAHLCEMYRRSIPREV
ncbi:circadian clock protein KaiA [Leptothoe spongobia]|uniref:Circadian clock oscillator protein KaiA n=1 Tax=Leptothoe spongobia TAU-MAC 1115 TaxID=1967444 RepID=A0A947DE42_9CYAN|nr:circadian clock protein KaiA [Leptothoe spongobia]MBT9314271.1 circadian clock protein KaiA [Leptothoe spongobia TAU-MAC 1115]